MSRAALVGLFAAIGAAMATLVGLAHGAYVWLLAVEAAIATGLAAYLACDTNKKKSSLSVSGDTGHLPGQAESALVRPSPSKKILFGSLVSADLGR